MILTIQTSERTELVDITAQVKSVVSQSGIRNGTCILFVPHTTAAITINESADPSVKKDLLKVMNKVIPWEDDYRHLEGNSAAHIKSTIVGASETLIIENSHLLMGIWQGIFYCEFDGPRTRKLHVKLIDC